MRQYLSMLFIIVLSLILIVSGFQGSFGLVLASLLTPGRLNVQVKQQ